MRFVVFGAGGIGGVLGGRLHQSGHEVALIARGVQGEAIREHGLRLESADETLTLDIETVTDARHLRWRDGDVVLLAMKSQDSEAALALLAHLVPPDTPVACVQNGVANERAAARYFENVYGVCVMCPTNHLDPGIVQAYSAPVTGIMDLGRYYYGVDDTAKDIAAAFRASSYECDARADIMRWKYRKLIMNLSNIIDAATGWKNGAKELHERVRAEADAVLRAASIDVATAEEDKIRRADHLQLRPIGDQPRGGGSTWQSLERDAGSLETDYLNGEIVLLGRLYDVPTPANALLQRIARELAQQHARPQSIAASDLLAQFDRSR